MRKALLTGLLVLIAAPLGAVMNMGFHQAPVMVSSAIPNSPAGGVGGGGFDLTIDTVAFGFTDNNHFLDINYTFSAGVDGVCAVGGAKDGGGQLTGATLAGGFMQRVAASPRSSGFLQVAIFCSTAVPSGTQEIEFLKTGDSPMLGVVVGFKGMTQNYNNLIHSSGTAADISATATSLSTGCTTTVLKNILLSGVMTYGVEAMSPEAGDTQLAQVAAAAASLIVTYQNADGGAVTTGASWPSWDRTEMAVVEVNDDPSENP